MRTRGVTFRWHSEEVRGGIRRTFRWRSEEVRGGIREDIPDGVPRVRIAGLLPWRGGSRARLGSVVGAGVGADVGSMVGADGVGPIRTIILAIAHRLSSFDSHQTFILKGTRNNRNHITGITVGIPRLLSYVKQCPNGWQKVVPSPSPSGGRSESMTRFKRSMLVSGAARVGRMRPFPRVRA
jgi:hypothetical protein